MKSIAFVNEKGGIGKTSICFNTGWELAKRHRVLLIDLDGQNANLSYFCNIKKTDEMLTIEDVLVREKNPKSAIQNVKENLDIIAANTEVAYLTNTAKISRMKKMMEALAEDYDYILVDVNPSPGIHHVLAMSSVKGIVIPTLPDVTSLEALTGIADSVEEIRETLNPNLKVLGIVFNRNERQSNLAKQVEEIATSIAVKKFNSKIFNARIRNSVRAGENVAAHIGITDYDPKSTVAQDYLEFISELEAMEV